MSNIRSTSKIILNELIKFSLEKGTLEMFINPSGIANTLEIDKNLFKVCIEYMRLSKMIDAPHIEEDKSFKISILSSGIDFIES